MSSTGTRRETGFLKVPEGQLYWVHDICASSASSSPPTSASRPTLLFIHAGVADHTMWDEQAAHFTAKGWNTLRYDTLGYGKSEASAEFLAKSKGNSGPSKEGSEEPKEERPKLRHHEHAAAVCKAVLGENNPRVVATGLSMGGAAALDLAVTSLPGGLTTTPASGVQVCGLVVAAGGLHDYDYPDPRADELAVFAMEEDLKAEKDVDGLARLMVRIWADGPTQEPGRAFDEVREKIYRWNLEICRREVEGTGGGALEMESIGEPPAVKRLEELGRRIPVAVALGRLDETCTIAGMRFVAKETPGAEFREFNTAHMINLEAPDEFNAWLEGWLGRHFPS